MQKHNPEAGIFSVADKILNKSEQGQKIPDHIIDLLQRENKTPVHIEEDRGVRIKVTDNCGMTCTFCHNEGTPVANRNQVEKGRVSIYEDFNGVNFNPAEFTPDQSFIDVLSYLKESLGLNELHWTGGEPTLTRNIVELTQMATDQGFTVKMTSNGETGARKMKELADAGLKSINFSIFGTTPEELAAVQAPRFRNPKFGAKKLQALHDAMRAAAEYGIGVKANVVIPSIDHKDRFHRILDEFGEIADIRLLPSLDVGLPSQLAIYEILNELNAEPVARYISVGSSNNKIDYQLPDGKIVGYKQISRITLPDTCADCKMNNPDDCQEGFYGIRLYKGDDGVDRVGVCIQRMDLTGTLGEFKESGMVEEIVRLKEKQSSDLHTLFGEFVVSE